MISSILALGLLGVAVPAANSVSLGSVCPVMKTAAYFDVSEFEGVWFEQAKYYDPTQKDVKCVTSEYFANEDGTVTIENEGFDATKKSTNSVIAIATIPDKADASKFKITFPAMEAIPESDYWIVGTDYENYSVIFACKQVTPESNRVRTWILTRAPNPRPEIIEIAMKVAAAHGIDTSLYLPTDQTNCDNYTSSD